MFVNSMKIVTLSKKDTVSSNAMQQHTLQSHEKFDGDDVSNANVIEFVSEESTQKMTSHGRDQHQKFSATHKAKYNHSNSSKNQQQLQHQKYSHITNNNNKHKKQNCNNNNSSSSALSRKKFYQQQTNLMQQKILHCHNHEKQHNCLHTIPHEQQQQQQRQQQHTNNITKVPAALPLSKNSNNNNSKYAKNQNMPLIQNSARENHRGNNNAVSVIPDQCTCSEFKTRICEQVEGVTDVQDRSLAVHRRSNQDSNPTSNNLSTTVNATTSVCGSASEHSTIPTSCSCWPNTLNLPPPTRSGHFRANKGSKSASFANKTNLQDFVAAALAHKCRCQMHSTVTAATSKKKTFWKHLNAEHKSRDDATIDSSFVIEKLSNENDVLKDVKSKIEASSCSSLSRHVADNNISKPNSFNIQNFQKTGACADSPSSASHAIADTSADAKALSSGSVVRISSPHTKNSKQTIEDAKDKSEDISNVVAASKDSFPKRSGQDPTYLSGRGSQSPNAYTLDFLHSVGVQITGATKHASLEPLLRTENNRMAAGPSFQHGSRNGANPTQRAPHSYSAMTNSRQPRGIVGNGNGNSNYHYHHHPPQLTIGSFLQKDLLGETSAPQITSGSGVNAMAASYSGFNEQRGHMHQQNYTRHHQHVRYHSNFFQTSHYQQQQAQTKFSGGYANNVGGSINVMPSNVAPQRSLYGSYVHYHGKTTGGNNLLEYHQMSQQQNSFSQVQVNNKNESHNNVSAKKQSHVSSSASSCSSSSTSSHSSYGSHHKQQQPLVGQRQQKSPSDAPNLPIETLPPKFLNQRQTQHHRGGNYHGHNYYVHRNHQGHHRHTIPNTATSPQHQNFYNLTYVSTDSNPNGSTGTTIFANCCPGPQPTVSEPLTTSPTFSPREQDTVSVPPGLPQNSNLENISPYVNCRDFTSVQQIHQYQHQKYGNKNFLVPSNLAASSTTPPLLTQPISIRPNIICCSQLDEATTAAAAASAKTGIIAGNECDASDTSSKNPTGVLGGGPIVKNQSLKPMTTRQHSQSDSHIQQSSTVIDFAPPPMPLLSSLDYVDACVQTHSGNNTGAIGTRRQQQLQPRDQHTCHTTANRVESALPQLYRNNEDIPFSNLAGQSPSRESGVAMSTHILNDGLHHRQQPHHMYEVHHLASDEHMNVVSAVPLGTRSNSSNCSSGYWNSSHHCNVLYQQMGLMASSLMGSNTPSCASSASSVSPCLAEHGDEQKTEFRNTHEPKTPNEVSSSAILSGQMAERNLGSSFTDGSPINSPSSNSSLSGQAKSLSVGTTPDLNCNGGSSTQVLAPHQQRLITHNQQGEACASPPPTMNGSGSTISTNIRLRNGVGRNHHLHTAMVSESTVSMSGSGSNVSHHPFPHIFPQQSSLTPLPLTHNLLFSNTQTHQVRSVNSASMNDFFTHTPPDRFLARAHLIETKETPAYLLNNSKWDNLSRGIWEKFVSLQQTEETFKQKMRLWRFLYLFIKNAYPRYGLYLVGSTISGFGSDSSDVDMCLVSRSASSVDPRMEALFNLTILRDCLSKSGEFENFNLIEAKVPILRFRDCAYQLEVDLNFNNCVGIKNTHLLYCYSQLDWRLRPLVLITKLWAQHHDINNAKNMTISSYSLVLMVIHFLQHGVNPPVLPCLHDMFPEKFPLLRSNDFGYVDMNETLCPYESKNNRTLGELFLNFLEYYSSFDYTQYAISVRTGGTLPINVCRVAKSIKNDPHQWKELCIEEPFDLTNTARSVYDYETFERVKAVFVCSWRVLQHTLNLNSVFDPSTMLPNTFPTLQQETSESGSGARVESGEDNTTQAFTKLQTPPDIIGDKLTSHRTPGNINVVISSIKPVTKYRETKTLQGQYSKPATIYEDHFSSLPPSKRLSKTDNIAAILT